MSNQINLDRIDENRLLLGVRSIDTELEGIDKGSTIALIGSSKTPVTMFLTQISSVNPTQYVTTDKPDSIIEQEAYITSHPDNREKSVPDDLEIYNYRSQKNVQDLSLKQYIEQLIHDRDDENVFIIDNYTTVGNSTKKDEYLQLTKDIYQTTSEKDGLTILYFLASGYDELTDVEKSAVNICDAVMGFNLIQGSDIHSELDIYRLRGRELERQQFVLNTGDTITVDETDTVN